MPTHHPKIASSADTLQYGSSSKSRYTIISHIYVIHHPHFSPSLCHKSLRLPFPAFARSHKIGRANCLSGDFCVMTRFNNGMIPDAAASSCRAFDRRHIEKMVWKMCEQISCNFQLAKTSTMTDKNPKIQLTFPCAPFIILPSNPTRVSTALEFCNTSMS